LSTASEGVGGPAGEDLGERRRLLLEVHVHRVGVHPIPGVAAVVRAALVDHDQLARLAHRQVAQHDLIDQGEDRRVGADPEGERQDGDDGEEGAATEPAEGIAEIAGQIAHKGHSTGREVGAGGRKVGAADAATGC
jgi:hypothetical protein